MITQNVIASVAKQSIAFHPPILGEGRVGFHQITKSPNHQIFKL